MNVSRIDPLKLNDPSGKIQLILMNNATLKDTAQRAFVSYAKAVYLMKDKEIFNVQTLDTDAFAYSLGLSTPPRIRFLQRLNNRKANEKKDKGSINNKTENKKMYFDDDEVQNKPTGVEDHDSDDSGDENIPRISQFAATLFHVAGNEGSEDEALEPESENDEMDLSTEEEDSNNKKRLSKAATITRSLKENIATKTKILFDEEGDALPVSKKKSKLALEYENENEYENEYGIDLVKSAMALQEEDKFDRQHFMEKVKAKHKEEKRKLKEQKNKEKMDEEEGERDEFGESESDEAPDLSWLPDPDKIYGEKSEEEIERLMEGSDEDAKQEEQELPKPKAVEEKSKKRKAKGKIDNLETVLKKKKKHKIEQISSSLTVNEAEELAMMLLKNK